MNMDRIEYIYLRNYNYFFVIANNICNDRELAKDIVQDGFMRILGSKEAFESVEHARKYLVGCVRNAAFATLSSEKRFKAMRADFLASDKKDEALISRIRTLALGLKCPTIRTIIKEIYFNGKTRTEIGAQYELSRKTIASKEKQGLQLLYNMITKQI